MKVIDITLKIQKEMTVFPDPKYGAPELDWIIKPEEDWMGRYSGRLSMHNHAGTHIDTPMHFNHFPGVNTVDVIPLDVLVGPAIVIGLPEVKTGPITAEMLAEKIPDDIITEGKRVIIWTGFNDDRWAKPDYFEDVPYFTGDAADWIVEHGFVLTASDANTDKFGDKKLPVHNTLLANGIYILEYICNVRELTMPETFLVVAPLPLKGMEAAPARAYVIEEIC